MDPVCQLDHECHLLCLLDIQASLPPPLILALQPRSGALDQLLIGLHRMAGCPQQLDLYTLALKAPPRLLMTALRWHWLCWVVLVVWVAAVIFDPHMSPLVVSWYPRQRRACKCRLFELYLPQALRQC